MNRIRTSQYKNQSKPPLPSCKTQRPNTIIKTGDNVSIIILLMIWCIYNKWGKTEVKWSTAPQKEVLMYADYFAISRFLPKIPRCGQ
jgi:hypothetical protein